MAGDDGKDDCELLNNEKKRNIAWKNALLVFGLFLILGSPHLYRFLRGLITGKSTESDSPRVSDFKGVLDTLKENTRFLSDQAQQSVVNTLGGVKISWIQHLIHSLLAAIITWLVTYYSMQPDKDRQSCLVASS
jgi:predicted PurR-regulated permease PerM